MEPLIIYEMANNHGGSVEHGKRIIEEFADVSFGLPFDFAFKFQYRDIDTFIHPDYQDRDDIKYVKRFKETRLTEPEHLELINECRVLGFKTICTPFDEPSVEKIYQHGYDYLKIGSPSIRDWPLLEQIAKYDMPIIASVGGLNFAEIDRLVSFLTHKNKQFSLLHCVGIYPTPNELLSLNKITWLRERYPEITIGYSTHENPDSTESIGIAYAKGARIFEKHVGIDIPENPINKYSCTPRQTAQWLDALLSARGICGAESIEDYEIERQEIGNLRVFKRGVFAKENMLAGSVINDTFLAFPASEGQMLADDLSVHSSFETSENIPKNGAVFMHSVNDRDVRAVISEIIHKVKAQLNLARIRLHPRSEVELSHHYGIERFDRYGATIINVINNDSYCKKIIIQTPGQEHPAHFHKIKNETFQILWGRMTVTAGGVKTVLNEGDIMDVQAGMEHSFETVIGVIFEEVSTTHLSGDSYYIDSGVLDNRKTKLTDWSLRW